MTCSPAWAAVLGARAAMLRLLPRLGHVWPRPRRASRAGRGELRFALGSRLARTTAALALVAPGDR